MIQLVFHNSENRQSFSMYLITGTNFPTEFFGIDHILRNANICVIHERRDCITRNTFL